jgi:hypothetical protein
MACIKGDFLGIYWSDLANSRLISAHATGLQVEKAGRLRSGSEICPSITTWKAGCRFEGTLFPSFEMLSIGLLTQAQDLIWS